MKGGLNVVGGAAVALTRLRVPALVDLGQGGLHKGGGAADDGDDPHPEHRAEAAGTDGGGDADDVARAHPGRGGYHQRLEGRGRPGLLRFFSHHTDGFQEHTELDEAGPEGEVQTRSQQQDDEHIAVHHSADVADQFVDHNTHTHFL